MSEFLNPAPCDQVLDAKARELFLLSAAALTGCGT